jgi:hypothetical protein
MRRTHGAPVSVLLSASSAAPNDSRTMAKSVRSKRKRKFRAIRRALHAPEDQRVQHNVARLLPGNSRQSLEHLPEPPNPNGIPKPSFSYVAFVGDLLGDKRSKERVAQGLSAEDVPAPVPEDEAVVHEPGFDMHEVIGMPYPAGAGGSMQEDEDAEDAESGDDDADPAVLVGSDGNVKLTKLPAKIMQRIKRANKHKGRMRQRRLNGI